MKNYNITIQTKNEKPCNVLLGVVKDDVDLINAEDDTHYFYMTQAEFDSLKTLIGVELDRNTFITDYAPAK